MLLPKIISSSLVYEGKKLTISFPDGFTVEKLLQDHSSRQRNQNIARVFYLAGFIEAWGRGFRKIHNEFEKAGLEQPTYDEHCGGFRVTIKR